MPTFLEGVHPLIAGMLPATMVIGLIMAWLLWTGKWWRVWLAFVAGTGTLYVLALLVWVTGSIK